MKLAYQYDTRHELQKPHTSKLKVLVAVVSFQELQIKNNMINIIKNLSDMYLNNKIT